MFISRQEPDSMATGDDAGLKGVISQCENVLKEKQVSLQASLKLQYQFYRLPRMSALSNAFCSLGVLLIVLNKAYQIYYSITRYIYYTFG